MNLSLADVSAKRDELSSIVDEKRERVQRRRFFSRFIDSMTKTFGEVLKQLMSERNLSVSHLAKAINCPPKTVQEWLGPHGRIPRDLDVLKRLAQFFNCSTHSLLFGEEDPRGILGDILEKTEIHTGLYEITIKKVKTGGHK